MRRYVSIKIHPSLFDKMEYVRKTYQNKGIKLSQVQQTSIIAQSMDMSRFRKINIFGGKNGKKIKR